MQEKPATLTHFKAFYMSVLMFNVLPIVLVCSRGSAVTTGFVALEGRPAPAWFTLRTLNWYRVPSFSPNTG